VLLRHASPAHRLLAACAKGDRAGAEAIVASHPDVVAGLTRDQMGLIAHRAHAAVRRGYTVRTRPLDF
jgi:hypothetical protein